LAQIERARKGVTGLEGAVVVTNVQNGEVQAVVGGRDAHFEGFNRALDAHRPVGSLLKPVTYLSALMHPERYTLATLLDDSPLVWKERGIPMAAGELRQDVPWAGAAASGAGAFL